MITRYVGSQSEARSLSHRVSRGGVAAGWAFLSMRGLGVGPRGFVFGAVNPVMVQGAVTAGLPIVAGIESAFFETVQTGDRIRINPQDHKVTILR
jgi:predicted aconitase with swiveling domain